MPTQKELDRVFINITKEIGSLSKCNRAKVGAILVKDGNIVSMSYNGTFAGQNNSCEDSDNNTKSEVIHAEMGTILKAAKSGHAVDGSTLYLSLSPCQNCCKLIIQSGIKRVVYLEGYRDLKPIEFLSKFIEVEKYDI
jgi:dCMP deaminase